MEPANEIETVLANGIGQALSPLGQLPAGTDPTAWVAARFAERWRERAEHALGNADTATLAIRRELDRLGGWEVFGEALHECCHLQQALADLRKVLGLQEE